MLEDGYEQQLRLDDKQELLCKLLYERLLELLYELLYELLLLLCDE